MMLVLDGIAAEVEASELMISDDDRISPDERIAMRHRLVNVVRLANQGLAKLAAAGAPAPTRKNERRRGRTG